MQIPWGNWDQLTGIMTGPRNTTPYSTLSILAVSFMVAGDHWFPLIQLKRTPNLRWVLLKVLKVLLKVKSVPTSAQPIRSPQYPAFFNLSKRREHDSDVIFSALLGYHTDKQLPVFHCWESEHKCFAVTARGGAAEHCAFQPTALTLRCILFHNLAPTLINHNWEHLDEI